jgi:hypothetical protein
MIRALTEADAEAIYELLFAARNEIPLSKIETVLSSAHFAHERRS